MPEAQISYPTSAYGIVQHYKRTAPFYNSSGSAIPAKRLVYFDGTGITIAATDTNAAAIIGVTDEAIPAGKVGPVVIEGVVEDMPSTGSIAQYAVVKRSTSTGGYVADATSSPATGEPIGHALGAAASNLVDIWVNKSYATTPEAGG